MVKLNLDKGCSQFELIPYIQGKEKAGVCILLDRSTFEESVAKLNKVIADDKQLKENLQEWMTRTSKGYIMVHLERTIHALKKMIYDIRTYYKSFKEPS